jgi:hypothetical protein
VYCEKEFGEDHGHIEPTHRAEVDSGSRLLKNLPFLVLCLTAWTGLLRVVCLMGRCLPFTQHDDREGRFGNL